VIFAPAFNYSPRAGTNVPIQQGVYIVGHSTGGGEVARYIGRHGSKRVKKAVLLAAVPPIMLKSDANPEGLPTEVFDGRASRNSRLELRDVHIIFLLIGGPFVLPTSGGHDMQRM
jgi:pimeloyl-ACP methyl ester carboxylesterase